MRTRGILAELWPAQLGRATQQTAWLCCVAASTCIIYCRQYIKKMWTCWTMFFCVERKSFTIYSFGKGSNMVWLLILLLVKWTFDCSCRPIKLNFPYCRRRSGLIWNLCQLNTLKRSTLFFKEKEKGKIVLFLVPWTSIRVNNLQSLKSISKSYETKI